MRPPEGRVIWGVECLFSQRFSAEWNIIAEGELKRLKAICFIDAVARVWGVMADVLIEEVIGGIVKGGTGKAKVFVFGGIEKLV